MECQGAVRGEEIEQKKKVAGWREIGGGYGGKRSGIEFEISGRGREVEKVKCHGGRRLSDAFRAPAAVFSAPLILCHVCGLTKRAAPVQIGNFTVRDRGKKKCRGHR